MKFLSFVFSSVLLSSAVSISVHAEDVHAGKEVHDESCLKCHKGNHDEKFYTRENRKVKDLKRLGTMVRLCDAKIGTALFDEDIQEITNYLNESYYKFPQK